MTKKHADASPSSASIWMKCPASVTMARGRVRAATPYTREGSAAHEIAEMLVHGLPIPDEVVVEGQTIAIDEEMVEAVGLYVDFCEKLRKKSDIFLTETRIKLDHLPEPIYGTADCIAYQRASKTVVVPDLKYGKGTKVDVAKSAQQRIYALGAVQALIDQGETPEKVFLVVIQPRIDGVAGVELMVGELHLWEMEELWPAVDRIAKDDRTEIPGDQCRWCVRAGECKTLAKQAQEHAKLAFSPLTGQGVHPTELSNEELAKILDKAEFLSTWLVRVQAEASQRIDRGQDVPGWKLVAKRAMRRWTDEKVALQKLVIDLNIPPEDVTKIVTVAAAERACKTHKISFDKLKKLVEQKSSGTTLVRASDARPSAAVSATEAFTAIESL